MSRNCPVCHEPMAQHRRELITVDVCEAHGIWLDKGELEAILQQQSVAESDRVNTARGRPSDERWKWLALGTLWGAG